MDKNTVKQIMCCVAETEAEKQIQQTVAAAFEKEGNSILSRQNTHHIVVSALVLDPAMQQVLMVHHNLFGTYTWPGGHADGEADLLSVALREVREETGIEKVYPLTSRPLSVDILPVPAHEKKGAIVPAHEHYAVTYACIAPVKQPLSVKADENSVVAWLAIDALDQYCNEAHMLPLYKKVYARALQLQQEKEARCGMLPEALLPWYRKFARVLPWRQDKEPYHVWLSEIMLQQTRVEAVKGYYSRFLEEVPTIEALAALPQERLLKLWEGLGYYTRAKNLQKAAKKIVEEYSGRFPQQYDELLKLPGVGAYTAGAIASICFEQAVPAVDGNVLRVLAQITELYEPVDIPDVKQRISTLLKQVYPTGACGDFTQALMELGATVCLPNGEPKCDACPANRFCMAYANGVADKLPKRLPKRARRLEEKTVFVLMCGDKTALQKRNETGLLAGLWELPNVAGKQTENEALQTASAWGVSPKALVKKVERKHIFTHVEWHMTCYYMQCSTEAQPFIWADSKQLEKEIALPTAFAMFMDEK